MNTISIVVYDNNSNGKSTKLFSVESNIKTSLEWEIAKMLLILETKIDINPMLISKHISVSKNRHHVVIEALDMIIHPEDFTPFSSSEQDEMDLIGQRAQNNSIGSD